MFDDIITRFGNNFQYNKLYLLSNGSVNKTNTSYANVNNEIELVLRNYTHIKEDHSHVPTRNIIYAPIEFEEAKKPDFINKRIGNIFFQNQSNFLCKTSNNFLHCQTELLYLFTFKINLFSTDVIGVSCYKCGSNIGASKKTRWIHSKERNHHNKQKVRLLFSLLSYYINV